MTTAAQPRTVSARYDATTATVAPLAPARERLLSLDVFRGITIAGMLLVTLVGIFLVPALFVAFERIATRGAAREPSPGTLRTKEAD